MRWRLLQVFRVVLVAGFFSALIPAHIPALITEWSRIIKVLLVARLRFIQIAALLNDIPATVVQLHILKLFLRFEPLSFRWPDPPLFLLHRLA